MLKIVRDKMVVGAVFALCLLILLVSSVTFGEISTSLLPLEGRRVESVTSLKGITIVVPEGEGFLALGNAIVATLSSRFSAEAELTVVAGRRVVERDNDIWSKDLILLGHFGNNPLIATLYGERLSYVDGYYPGQGGYVELGPQVYKRMELR